ncbi:MAG: hypothetical protein ABI612_01085 [Betaproteobacteria bacterium]
MNVSNAKLVIAAALSAVALTAAAASSNTDQVSGRAGGLEGAARIQQLSTVQQDHRADAPDTAAWYGRAGGPVAQDRSTATAKSKEYSAGQSDLPLVHGRAGVPLPFGG